MRTASISLSTRCLFMSQLLPITRPAEAAEARWDEIDFDTGMEDTCCSNEVNRDHTVPLSDGALAILELMNHSVVVVSLSFLRVSTQPANE
ncbi:hypothetical protein ACNKHV_16625 [Shigella flexneri]